MNSEVDHPVGVAVLIVVPGDDLDELGAHPDPGSSVVDGALGVGHEVGADEGLIGVAHEAFVFAVGGSLDLSVDLLDVGNALLQSDGQVNNRDVDGWDSEGHASEQAVQLGNDLADGLGGSSCAWDDVLATGSAEPPLARTGLGAIDRRLGSSQCVDRGHETLLNSPLVVDDLGQGGQAVRGAGSVGDDIHVRGVGVLVDAHDKGWGVVAGRRGENDLLGSTLEMS